LAFYVEATKVATMNEPEARIALLEHIADVLLDLTEEEDASIDDREDMREAMRDLADILLESLDAEIVEASGAQLKLNVTLR
jgi:uncharacterized ubiquitin-like protein YukD